MAGRTGSLVFSFATATKILNFPVDGKLDVTVHEGFDYWIADVEDKDSMAGALDQANEAAYPTARLTQVEAAYWTNVGTKEHLRWVLDAGDRPS